MRKVGAALIRIGLLVYVACGCAHPQIAHAASLCESCEVQLGLGGTYHYWGATGGVVVPVLVNWSDARYELGFFRVTTQQNLQEHGSRYSRLMAEPYWGVSLSRRWTLLRQGPVRLFFGFGLSGKSKSDQLSSTCWDFASQLGLRFKLPGSGVIAELTMRHWSNGGVHLPNHGQDFATLTIRVNSEFVGADRDAQITIDPQHLCIHGKGCTAQTFENMN